MNILFIADDKKGTGFYRMMMPANEIRKANMANVRLCFAVDQNDIQWADIVVVQRAHHPSMFEMFDWAKSIGKVMVYEIDDYLQGVDPTNPAYRSWTPAGPHLQRALALMEKADAMTVTTDRLQREYAPWNKNIFVIPNFLDKTLFPPAKKVYKDKLIRIGYTGFSSHQKDLELIDDIMTKICEKYPEVRFKVMGIIPEHAFKRIPQYNYKYRGVKIKSQLEYISGTDITAYFYKLADQGWDIGLAPLIDNSFNACKSDLKIKEYGALSIPVVASNVYPYQKAIKQGYNGFLASTGKEWYEAIEKLILDKKLRQEIGNNNLVWVNENGWIQDNVAVWINTYQHIYDNMLKATGITPQ